MEDYALNTDSEKIIFIHPEEVSFFERFLESRKIPWEENQKKENTLALSKSLTGYIRTPKRKIILSPKYSEVNISHIIRLYNYVYSYHDKEDDELLDITESSQTIVKSFLSKLQEQLLIGLLQDYSRRESNINFLKGRVDYIKSYKNSRLLKNRPVKTDIFQLSLDLPINRLIVGALKKITKSNEYFSQSMELLAYFDGVSPIEERASDFLATINFNSKDLRYKKIASEAAMIIDSLFYDATQGSAGGESFLVNFDSLFEKFIVKILLKEVEEHDFSTWEDRRSFATEYFNGEKISMRIYQPDLLYKFNPENELQDYQATAEAVIDVKNKAYSIFKNADIYQIMLYNQLLYAKKNILVYPSFAPKSSTTLFIDNEKIPVPYIHSVFINITQKTAEGFKQSIQQFIYDLYDCLDSQYD